MRQKSGPEKQPAEDAIRDIRRATRRHFSAEEKIRVVLGRAARGGEHSRALPPLPAPPVVKPARAAAKVRLICIDIFVYNAARNYAGTTRVAKPAEQIPSALSRWQKTRARNVACHVRDRASPVNAFK
jgi:hypothetical protein